MSNDRNGESSGRSHETRDGSTQDMDGDSGTMETGKRRDPATRDNVVLTDMATQLKSLEQFLVTQPEVDQNHVNRIREAIKRGEYHVSPDRVADKLMGFEEDF